MKSRYFLRLKNGDRYDYYGGMPSVEEAKGYARRFVEGHYSIVDVENDNAVVYEGEIPKTSSQEPKLREK